MAKYVTAKEDIVPFGQKLAFGSGHLANQLFPAALGVFMVVLVLALKMDPFLAGVLAAVPRLLDALTDPIMGYISDNTRSKWGRRKPYIFHWQSDHWIYIYDYVAIESGKLPDL